ncbi:SAM-dependent methyltransferase, partial [Alcanivorax sp. KX64203]
KASRIDAATAFADYPDAVRWSLPDWLWQQWQSDWPDQAAAMAEASLTPPPLTLRVNQRHHHRDHWLTQFGDEARAGALSPWALYLSPPRPVTALPGFAEGELTVQDEAAQLPVTLMAVPDGARILDACAAPGGKTGQLAEAFPGARLVALDVSEPRLRQVREALKRLGAEATVLQGDAAEPQSWWDGEPFDTILLDAPCSATGILRRQPDVKWHRRRQDLPALVDLQARMLDALWPLLRPGGTLVYATCSVLRAENDQQISAFLERTEDATEDTPGIGDPSPASRGWQLLPRDQGPDGFYLARLRKTMG